jgi:hypothetical protein
MKRRFLLASLLAAAQLALAQFDTPKDVAFFLRDVARDLANAHSPDPIREPYVSPREFLDHFDSSMPGYEQLSGDVKDAAARAYLSSTIDVADDTGDDHKRAMKLDWLLEIHDPTLQQDRPPRRVLVSCTIEKHGKTWKFTKFDPIDLFKY